MFKLVGSEVFHVGKRSKVAEITITSKGMSFEYVLTVEGKPLEKFVQAQVESHGCEYVDLDKSLASSVIGAESNTASPNWGEVGEKGGRQTRIGACPRVGVEGIDVSAR